MRKFVMAIMASLCLVAAMNLSAQTNYTGFDISKIPADVKITEESKDRAYEAPKSSFVGTWVGEFMKITFNSNGTGTRLLYLNPHIIEGFKYFEIYNFKWTKNGNEISMVGNHKLFLAPEDKEAYNALSARKKAIVDEAVAEENATGKTNHKMRLVVEYLSPEFLGNSNYWLIKTNSPKSTTNKSQATKKTSTTSKKKSRKK